MNGTEPIETESYTSCEYGMTDDALQVLSAHESHNDSAYFNFIADDGVGIAGAVIRIGMRPNEGYSEASVVMPCGDGTVFFHYARSPLSADGFPVGSPVWESGALRLEATEPTRRWGLTYTSREGRVVADPSAFGDDPGTAWRASARLECAFDLEWQAAFPIHVLSPGGNLMPGDTAISYGKNHYEQFGRMSGALRIGDDEWQIDAAPAFRDHSWGPRIWENAPDQDFVTAYLDDGRRVVAVANRADGREAAHGVVWTPGQMRPIQIDRYAIHTEYDGDAPAQTVGWTLGSGGEVIEIEGTVVGFMPLRVGGRSVRIAQMILRLDRRTPGWAKTDLTRPIAGGRKIVGG